jgi:hypothetical protein
MSEAKPAAENVPLECEVCLKEIPPSAAFTPEGSEYVGHFCGIECYQIFMRRQREAAASQDID